MSIETTVANHLVSPERSVGLPPGAILPDYGGYAVDGVPALIEHILGVRETAPRLAEALDPGAGAFDHVLFLLLDGLGYDRLLRREAADPGLLFAELAKRGRRLPITSVFPSTTTTSLTTYSTGLPPIAHGMLGYRLYLREAASVTNMIRFSTVANPRGDSALTAGLDLDRLVPGLTLYERLAEARVATQVLLPQHICSSGLSRLLYRGADTIHPCATLADMCVTARQLLQRAENRNLVTLYHPGLDTIGHGRGPNTDAYNAELGLISEALRRELDGQVGRTLLIISSDHGFVPLQPADYLELPKSGDVWRSLAHPPVGEPRASYLHARANGSAALKQAVESFSSGRLWVSAASDATDVGLFGTGTPHAEFEYRIGDVLAVSTQQQSLYHDFPDAVRLAGMHGGLTREEMLVPLIVCPM